VKEAINRAYESSLAEGLLFERREFHATFALDDQKEGMRAFVDKRKPEFKHRERKCYRAVGHPGAGRGPSLQQPRRITLDPGLRAALRDVAVPADAGTHRRSSQDTGSPLAR